MKITAKIFGILLLVMLQVENPGRASAQPGVSVSFSLFYNSLAPYGGWISDPSYGYVWVPDVGPSFRPYYSGGHWVMTTYGNMWVSDYAWGWAPFHYGRWIYDGYYGWVWVPDNTWGPAWVSWRWGGGYCGWAPLGPGVSMAVAFNSYAPPNDWWVFVPPTYMYSPVFYRYNEGPAVNAMYVRRTSPVSNTYVQGGTTYIAGPRRSDVENATNRSVPVYDVREGSKPSQAGIAGNTVRVYKPDVRTSVSGARVAPKQVMPSVRTIGKMEPLSANGGRAGRFEDAARQEKERSTPEQRERTPAQQAVPAPSERQAPHNDRQSAPASREQRTMPQDERMHENRRPAAPPDNSRVAPEHRQQVQRNEMPSSREQRQQAPAPRNDVRSQPERPLPMQREERPQQQERTMPPQQRMERPQPNAQPHNYPGEKRMNIEQQRPQMQQRQQSMPQQRGEPHQGKK